MIAKAAIMVVEFLATPPIIYPTNCVVIYVREDLGIIGRLGRPTMRTFPKMRNQRRPKRSELAPHLSMTESAVGEIRYDFQAYVHHESDSNTDSV
jgi:hypothetical protein